MKLDIFRKIIDTNTFTIKGNISETISKFQQMGQTSNAKDNEGIALKFACSENGNFRIRSKGYSRYYICGDMKQESGKIVITLREVCDYTMVLLRWVLLIALAAWVVFRILTNGIPPVSLVAFVALLIAVLKTTFNEKKNASLDLDIMKKDLIKTIEAVERWDE